MTAVAYKEEHDDLEEPNPTPLVGKELDDFLDELVALTTLSATTQGYKILLNPPARMKALELLSLELEKQKLEAYNKGYRDGVVEYVKAHKETLDKMSLSQSPVGTE